MFNKLKNITGNLLGASNQVPASCPYCYTAINFDQVAFRCSGRGLPGRPECQKVVDDVRVNLFNDSLPYMPIIRPAQAGMPSGMDATGAPQVLAKESATCGGCGGTSQVRVCPQCHTILPLTLDATSAMFGLVGGRQSGKTVLLTVLHKELTGNVARRFNAAIANPGGTTGLAADLTKFNDAIKVSGKLPDQTSSVGGKKQPPAVYEWRYNQGGKPRYSVFSFYDNAGEDLADRDRALDARYLQAASGIILLLDPFSFPENQAKAVQAGINLSESSRPEDVLEAITYSLAQDDKRMKKGKITTPLAVVITKIDAFFDQIPDNHPLRRPSSTEGVFSQSEAQDISDHVASLINSWGGDGLLRSLEHGYSNYRFFGVSALGAEPDYRSNERNARGLLPHRVAEPLLWLMADRKFIPEVQ